MMQLEQAHAILDEAITTYHPSHVFALFSGGYDSLTMTYVTLNYLTTCYPHLPVSVAHINTGIGIEETRDFVRTTCASYGWPLKEYHAPERYEDIVLENGFPGPASHRYMYVRLKERCLDQLIREHKQFYRDRILLVTGVRKQESTRRMGHVLPVHRDGVAVWTSPLLNWSKMEVMDCLEQYNLPRNEVVDNTHKSGECLCGAFAHKGELEEINFWYPSVGCRLQALQEQVHAAGFPWGWEEKPPKAYLEEKRGQLPFPGLSYLCSSCDARSDEQEKQEIA